MTKIFLLFIYVWKSAHGGQGTTLWRKVSPLTFTWVIEVKLTFPGLQGKCFVYLVNSLGPKQFLVEIILRLLNQFY